MIFFMQDVVYSIFIDFLYIFLSIFTLIPIKTFIYNYIYMKDKKVTLKLLLALNTVTSIISISIFILIIDSDIMSLFIQSFIACMFIACMFIACAFIICLMENEILNKICKNTNRQRKIKALLGIVASVAYIIIAQFIIDNTDIYVILRDSILEKKWEGYDYKAIEGVDIEEEDFGVDGWN